MEQSLKSQVLREFKMARKPRIDAKGRGKVMLWHIKSILHCHLPDLSSHLSSIDDPRKGKEYSIEELLMAGIVLFVLRCDSRNSFNHMSNDKKFCKNYYRTFRMYVPHMDAVNDLMVKIDAKELEDIRCKLFSALIEKHVFHKFRFFDKYFTIGIDATGIYNWGENPPDDIAKYTNKKTSKHGKVNYFTLVVEVVLICSNGMTISLMSEWVANESKEYVKQDCELNAFKRVAVRLKNCFPRLPVCLLVDGLYTNVALMDVCDEYGWKYITVFKDGNLSSVWEEVESLIPLNEKNIKIVVNGDNNHWYTHDYRWLNDIEYQKYKIHWMKCTVAKKHRKTEKTRSNGHFSG